MKKLHVTENHLTTSSRHLPHWQIGGSWYFLTFRSKGLSLTPDARSILSEEILVGHRRKYGLAIAVVMPDHVHLLLRPLKKDENGFFALVEFMKPLKGVSANRVNRLLGRSGSVWQDESFDRIVRDEREWLEKYRYVRNNAVKAGLADKPEDYPWLLERDDLIKTY